MRMEASRRKNDKQNRIPLLILIVLLAVVLITVVVVAIQKNRASAQGQVTEGNTQDDQTEKWQEGIVSYNGKEYRFNSDLHIYLLMGIDKEGKAEPVEVGNEGGQADALFLLVANSHDKTISIVSINRNSMTSVHMCGQFGDDLGTAERQICLQHAYGDGMHLSCSRTQEAVSHLFYELPIDGYVSFRLDAVPIMNDAIGGTRVTVLQDVSYPEAGVDLKEGETVQLNGTEAYWYVRGRDTDIFNSATDRLRRQEQFITEFSDQFKDAVAGDVSKALEVYDSISDYLVTNVDYVELISELIFYDYDDSRLYTVPGEMTHGEFHDEYYVDEDALYDLIIRVFYEEVKDTEDE